MLNYRHWQEGGDKGAKSSILSWIRVVTVGSKFYELQFILYLKREDVKMLVCKEHPLIVIIH